MQEDGRGKIMPPPLDFLCWCWPSTDGFSSMGQAGSGPALMFCGPD